MTEYKVVPLNSILKEEDEIKKQRVSEVARASGGFLSEYKKHKTFGNFKDNIVPNGSEDWESKRRNFIKRHLAQYRQQPTERRRLALLVWGYKV